MMKNNNTYSNHISPEQSEPKRNVDKLTAMRELAYPCTKPQHILSIPSAISPQISPNHVQSNDQRNEESSIERLGKQYNYKEILHVPRAQRPKRKCVRKRPHYFDDDDDDMTTSIRRFSPSSTSAFTKKTLSGKKQQLRTKAISSSASSNESKCTLQNRQKKKVKNNFHRTITHPIQTKHSCILQVSPRHNRLVILSVNNHHSMDNQTFGNVSGNRNAKKSERICFQVKGSQQGFVDFESLLLAKKARTMAFPSKKEMNEAQLLNLDLPHPTSEWYVTDNGLCDGDNWEHTTRMQGPFVDTKVAMKSLVSDDINSNRSSQKTSYGEVSKRDIRSDQIKSSLDIPQCQEQPKQHLIFPLFDTSQHI